MRPGIAQSRPLGSALKNPRSMPMSQMSAGVGGFARQAHLTPKIALLARESILVLMTSHASGSRIDADWAHAGTAWPPIPAAWIHWTRSFAL